MDIIVISNRQKTKTFGGINLLSKARFDKTTINTLNHEGRLL